MGEDDATQDIRAKRVAAVGRMRHMLREVEPVALPILVLALIAVPVCFAVMAYQAVLMGWLMVRSMVFGVLRVVTLPFFAAYVWVDMCILTVWFFRAMVNKMKGN